MGTKMYATTTARLPVLISQTRIVRPKSGETQDRMPIRRIAA